MRVGQLIYRTEENICLPSEHAPVMSIVDGAGGPLPLELITLTQRPNSNEDYLVINPTLPSHIGTF
jgi:hypothetical protein